jgi:hypothetical protein
MALAAGLGLADAWNFAYGVNPTASSIQLGSSSTSTGALTYIVETGQAFAGDGTPINPLFVNAVINVGSGSNAEAVVVTAFSNPTPGIPNTASFTATFANAHGAGEQIASGSYGAQEAAAFMLNQGGGLVSLGPRWFRNFATHAAGITAMTAYKSLSNLVTLLDYSGIPGVFSYNAAANSIYASTTHVLY